MFCRTAAHRCPLCQAVLYVSRGCLGARCHPLRISPGDAGRGNTETAFIKAMVRLGSFTTASCFFLTDVAPFKHLLRTGIYTQAGEEFQAGVRTRCLPRMQRGTEDPARGDPSHALNGRIVAFSAGALPGFRPGTLPSADSP